jgi:hypothetical protein
MPIVEYEVKGNIWTPREGGSGPDVIITPTRDNLIPGDFFPDATNTGHITPRNQMTVVTGNLSWGVEHDNMVITKTVFTGRVQLNCINILFIDCIFEGGAGLGTGSFAVWCSGLRCLNIEFRDCTIKPVNPDRQTHCISGHHFTLTRVDSSGGVDTLSVVAPNNSTIRADVFVIGSWLHDMAYFSPDAAHSDNQTHNDSCQWTSGKGLTYLGSRVEGFADPNIGNVLEPSVDNGTTHISGNKVYPKLCVASGIACISGGTTYSPLGELKVQKSWFSGGSVGINVFAAAAAGYLMTADGSVIEDCFFGWDWLSGQDNVIYLQNSQPITVRNNWRWGGATPWYHGDANSLPPSPRREDVIDPFDKSTPFTVIKRFA